MEIRWGRGNTVWAAVWEKRFDLVIPQQYPKKTVLQTETVH
jgi:hypothetical protein